MMNEDVYCARARAWAESRNDLSLPGKKVLMVGMARSGVAAAEMLCREGALVTVTDPKTAEALGERLAPLAGMPILWCLGEDGTEAVRGQEMVVMSPGVPPDVPVARAARAAGIPVTGELEVAARLLKSELMAVTGTNGKTTTVTLLGLMLENAGIKAFVAGNVGYPLSAAALESVWNDVTVAEVSSFQLETTVSFHPFAAAVLNISEDHLNRHGTMENYIALKRHIFDEQTEKDFAVLNYDDPVCRAMAEGLKAKVLYFSRQEELEEGAFLRDGQMVLRLNGRETVVCARKDVYIPGPHNTENALAAMLMAAVRGVPAEAMAQALRTFRGVEHRIEFVRELDGVRYINDSKGTNVDSTVKAVLSMERPTAMILGGFDKHADFGPLTKEIKASPFIRHCVLTGHTAPKIEAALLDAGFTEITHAGSLGEAVEKCRALSADGWNVLFSPACASFDAFKDYEQRGRIFKQIVNELQ